MQLAQQIKMRQSQSLVMTPQLQQAIKLLQMTNIELCQYLENQQSENPFLEIETSIDSKSSSSEENKNDGPVIYSASWISSNFITYDSQKVIADYGTRYT